MRKMMTLALAAGALTLVGAGLHPAKAADMALQQGQAPAPAYYPPPAQAYAYPPPVAYYAPPPVAYYAPAYAARPGPYYARWRYWRGYVPRFAYGYGHWGHGWHR
jgi:hypothetical protein